jgi:hypothetical protein
MRLQVLKNGVCVPDAHMIVNFAYVLGIACFKLEAILVTPVLRHLQVDASNLNDCFLFLPAQEGPRRPRTTPACFPGLSSLMLCLVFLYILPFIEGVASFS